MRFAAAVEVTMEVLSPAPQPAARRHYAEPCSPPSVPWRGDSDALQSFRNDEHHELEIVCVI
jgi:hypothetical protein